MNRTRRVIADADREFNLGSDTAQLSVKAWLHEDGTVQTDKLSAAFEKTGKVICFHASKWVKLNQCYVADTTEIADPGGPCRWQVSTIVGPSAAIINAPSDVISEWDLFKFCTTPLAGGYDSNDLHDDILVLLARGKFVGPFVVTSDRTRLKPKISTVKIWNAEAVLKIQGRVGPYAHPKLPHSRTYCFDPGDAVRKLLRYLKDQRDFSSWLSKNKITQLEQEFAQATEIEEIDWIRNDFNKFLKYLEEHDDLLSSINHVFKNLPSVKRDLEQARSAALEEIQAKVEGEFAKRLQGVKKREEDVTNLEAKVVGLRTEADGLEAEVKMLSDAIAERKLEAEIAFTEELRNLAAKPAAVAALASLFPNQQTPLNQPPAEKSLVCVSPTRSQPSDRALPVALKANYRAIGITSQSAHHIAGAVSAALSAGQPVTFTGLVREAFATATVATLSRAHRLQLDTPAGLLEPIVWPSHEGGVAVQVRNINMAAVELALGNLYSHLAAQALAGTISSIDFVFTATSDKGFFGASTVPFGPIIDTDAFQYNPGKLKDGDPVVESDHSQRTLKDYEVVEQEAFSSWNIDLSNLPGAFQASLGHVLPRLENSQELAATTVIAAWWLLPRSEGATVELTQADKLKPLGIVFRRKAE